MYRLSPSWRIVERNDSFEIYGGDDARFQLDPSPLVSRLAAGDAVTRDGLDPRERPSSSSCCRRG